MNIRAYFPLNRRICPGDTGALIVTIVLYLVICGVAGVLRWVVGWLPVVGWVFRILCWLIGVYCLAGIVLAIVDCVRQ